MLQILNKFLFLTAKPIVYLVNLSEGDYIRKVPHFSLFNFLTEKKIESNCLRFAEEQVAAEDQGLD